MTRSIYKCCCTLIVVEVALLAACAPPMLEMHRTLREIDTEIGNARFTDVIATVERDDFYRRKNNRLLLNLDAGGAHFFGGEYVKAAGHLTRAGALAEEFYTKSLSTHALSLLSNNLALPYYGEDYEITFASGIAALAFAAEGRRENAIVEVRKVEHRLGVMSAAYEGGEKYHDDAFAHYLSGALYEAAGNPNDAAVSYRRAWELYGGRFFPERPELLRLALLRSSAAAGIDPGIEAPEFAASADSSGPVVLLAVFAGRGPRKEEVSMEIPFTKDGVSYSLKAAIPVLVTRGSRITAVRVALDDGPACVLESAADYNRIGEAVFADKRPVILARTVARLSIRYLALRAAKEKLLEKYRRDYEKLERKLTEKKSSKKDGDEEKNGGKDKENNGKKEKDKNKDEDSAHDIEFRMDMAKMKMNAVSWMLDHLANELLEHADTRCSALCPAQAYFAPFPASPGEHRLLVEYLDASGAVIETVRKTADIRDGAGAVVILCAPY